MDTLIIFAAEYLPWWTGGGALLFYFFGRDKKRELRMVTRAFAGALLARFIFTEIIRYFYARPRPFGVLENALQLIQHSPGGSFPSGHAAFFFALATGIFFYRKWWGILFYALAFAISFGRVLAGIHWTSDILAGAIVGIFSAWIIKKVLKKIELV